MVSNQDRRMYYYNLIEENINHIFFARSHDEVQENMQSLIRDLQGLVRTVEDNIRLQQIKLEYRRKQLEKNRGNSNEILSMVQRS